MDKLVDRVTIVQGSGPTRKTETVYDSREEEYPTIPIDGIVRSVTVVQDGKSEVIFRSRHWEDKSDSWHFDEGTMRRFLKADMIRAQEAYKQHRESASDDKQLWWLDLPANMVRAFIKAGREVSDDKRLKHAEAGADRVAADLRSLKNDVRTTAADMKSDTKSKASDLKAKAKGA